MKYALMLVYRKEYSVVLMARALGVARSGFYRWLSRKPESADSRRAQVLEAVQTTFKEHKHRYGSPRVARELQAEGIACSENWIAKLMRDNGLQAHNGRGYRYFPPPNARSNVEDNRLNREFCASAPNRSGWRILPISKSTESGCIWRRCWIYIRVLSWVGRWPER